MIYLCRKPTIKPIHRNIVDKTMDKLLTVLNFSHIYVLKIFSSELNKLLIYNTQTFMK